MSYKNIIILDYEPKIPLIGINSNQPSVRPTQISIDRPTLLLPKSQGIKTSLLNPVIRSPMSMLNLNSGINQSLASHLIPKRYNVTRQSKRINRQKGSVKQRRARSKFKKASRKCRGSRNYRKCMSKKLSKKTRSKKSKRLSRKQSKQRSKFKKAARKCKGSRNYRKCMSKKLSK